MRIKGDLRTFIAALEGQGIECHETDEDIMRVFVPAGRSAGESSLAAAHGVQVRHLRPSLPTLEDVFAKAIGEA